MRQRMARALVRWVSRWHNASYSAWCRYDQGLAPEWYSKLWAAGGRRAQKVAFPVARRLDREAMGQQMVDECWWGMTARMKIRKGVWPIPPGGCRRCFTSGWVFALVDLLDGRGDGTKPCPVCGGSGRLRVYTPETVGPGP